MQEKVKANPCDTIIPDRVSHAIINVMDVDGT